MLAFEDKQSITAISNSMPDLQLTVLEPLPAISMIYKRWGTDDFALSLRETRAACKEAQARELAKTLMPPPKAFWRVTADIDVELNPNTRGLLATLARIENTLLDAVGGRHLGILDVQLFSTTTGRPLLNKMNVIVCDAVAAHPKRCDAFIRKLTAGTALLQCDKIKSLCLRRNGRIFKTLLAEPEA